MENNQLFNDFYRVGAWETIGGYLVLKGKENSQLMKNGQPFCLLFT